MMLGNIQLTIGYDWVHSQKYHLLVNSGCLKPFGFNNQKLLNRVWLLLIGRLSTKTPRIFQPGEKVMRI